MIRIFVYDHFSRRRLTVMLSRTCAPTPSPSTSLQQLLWPCRDSDRSCCPRDLHHITSHQINNTDPKVPTKIWGPVCGITNFSLASDVARVACGQRYRIQHLPWAGDVFITTTALAPRVPNYILIQAVSPGDFNPAAGKAYVTITGRKRDNPTKLQDHKYTVREPRYLGYIW
ncbi:hypothetical protein VaNZ11_011707, partial [Volvox africanus]